MLSLQTHSLSGARLATPPASLSSRSILSTRRTAINTMKFTLNNQDSRNMSWWGRSSDWWERVDPRFHKWVKQRLQDVQAQDQFSWKSPQLNTRSHKHRCFSRTKEQEAQHSNSGHDGDKPEGLSDYEWVRLNYIKVLRKRLEKDPYDALFGKSNQWLNGLERRSSWISEHLKPMLIHNEVGPSKTPEGKGDTTNPTGATANAQANSNIPSQGGPKQSLGISSSSSPLPSSASPHSPTPKWVYDPVTGRMVMEQAEESPETTPTRITQKDDTVNIPVKPFMSSKRKATTTGNPSVLSAIDDSKIPPYEVGNPLDDALAEYENRAQPYRVSKQGDDALDKALSDYENRQMAEHNYQHRCHSEFIPAQQEWLVHGHPEAPKQGGLADKTSKQPEKYIEELAPKLPISSQKQVVNDKSLGYSERPAGFQSDRPAANGIDLGPPTFAFEQGGNREWEQHNKSSASHKECLVQESFTESPSTNIFTASPINGCELKHSPTAPKESEPDILRKLPPDDIDLLRPSDIRARMGIIKEPRKETNGEKIERRAQLEKNFEYVHRRREGGLETSLERLIRVTENRTADQGLKRKPTQDRSLRSTQVPSDLVAHAGSDNLLLKKAYGFDEWGYSRMPMGLETSSTDEVAHVKNGKRKSLEEKMAEMSGAATQMRTDNEREVAARHKLHEEIKAQKDAMRGLSDDGYSRKPMNLDADIDNPIHVKSGKRNGLHSQLIKINREAEVADSDVVKAEKEILDIAAKRRQWLHDVALVREIRSIYEDQYGVITTQHRQEKLGGVNQLNGSGMKVSRGLNDYENRMGPKLYGFTTGGDNLESEMAAMGVNPSINALFDYSPSAVTSVQSTVSSEPTAPSPAVSSVADHLPTESAVPPSTSKAPTSNKTTETPQASEPRPSTVHITRSTPPSDSTSSSTLISNVTNSLAEPPQSPELPPFAVAPVEGTKTLEPALKSATDSTISPQSSITGDQESKPASTPQPSTPRVYKVLAYDPSTDTLTTATTLTPLLPLTSEPLIPLPTALSKLSNPGKFLPHLPPAFEPITSTANLLILRETSDPITASPAAMAPQSFASATQPRFATSQRTEDSPASSASSSITTSGHSNHRINPVDGTTIPLPEAPTGNFASPTGFVNHDGFSPPEEEPPPPPPNTLVLEPEEQGAGREEEGGRSERRGGGIAGVAKTAIWATAVCYVAGVVGELMK
ncbi:uncharacterized protein K441DRAFT_698326 [Cenococcum geophilum 1.58]|uniref:uncharacterized protein n=1 Tax=Cenococcum geophilum 1.58 TaxID=794803 RepID=UPI00358FD6F3|nr:hypothetical protein K441DRAFT_698326 [Cenococcum geophilum 1.58]